METITPTETRWIISVADLDRLANPMRDDAWGCGVIEEWDVLACEDISIGRLPAGLTAEDSASIEYNIARIAWLMEKGWDDDLTEPIRLATTVYEGCTTTWLPDGNHRASAAILMGEKTITVKPHGNVGNLRKVITPLAEKAIPLSAF